MNRENGPLRDARLIRSLHYFEAVARHGSLKLAAEELGVSQSAVSHQLRDLTTTLGEQLFIRAGRGIALTDTGMRRLQSGRLCLDRGRSMVSRGVLRLQSRAE